MIVDGPLRLEYIQQQTPGQQVFSKFAVADQKHCPLLLPQTVILPVSLGAAVIGVEKRQILRTNIRGILCTAADRVSGLKNSCRLLVGIRVIHKTDAAAAFFSCGDCFDGAIVDQVTKLLRRRTVGTWGEQKYTVGLLLCQILCQCIGSAVLAGKDVPGLAAHQPQPDGRQDLSCYHLNRKPDQKGK